MGYKNDWETKLSPMLRETSRLNSDRYGRVIIELAQGEDGKVRTFIENNQGVVKRKIGVVPSIVAELPFAVIPNLARSAQVKKIWVDSEINIKVADK